MSSEESARPHATRPHLLADGPLDARLQWYTPPRRSYSRRELLADRIVNFSGAVLSWVGTPILGFASWAAGDPVPKQVGFWAHGAGMVTMLTCSALYHHWSWNWAKSQRLLSLDHLGISTMIMGCYIPVMQYCDCIKTLLFVCTLGVLGWLMEAYKLVSGRQDLSGGGGKWSWFDVAHIVRYVVMGWTCIVVFPWMRKMPMEALALSGVGGTLYTAGICIFIQGNLEFHLAIWHVLVLIASLCFYLSNILALVGSSADGSKQAS